MVITGHVRSTITPLEIVNVWGPILDDPVNVALINLVHSPQVIASVYDSRWLAFIHAVNDPLSVENSPVMVAVPVLFDRRRIEASDFVYRTPMF